MDYEWELRRSAKIELPPPSKVTIPWLFRHLSLPIWVSGIAVVALAWGIGFAMGKNDFFRQLRDLIISAGAP
jgi:hypothetical protein